MNEHFFLKKNDAHFCTCLRCRRSTAVTSPGGHSGMCGSLWVRVKKKEGKGFPQEHIPGTMAGFVSTQGPTVTPEDERAFLFKKNDAHFCTCLRCRRSTAVTSPGG